MFPTWLPSGEAPRKANGRWVSNNSSERIDKSYGELFVVQIMDKKT